MRSIEWVLLAMTGWRKVLYCDQGFPDNYIEPELFLADLKKNLHTKTHKYIDVVKESGPIVQQFSCVCSFVCLFLWVQQEWLPPTVLLLLFSLFIILCHAFIEFSTYKAFSLVLSKLGNIQQFLMVIFFLCLLSPILKTLTKSISTDTIWAMSFGMMLVHLIFHNYGAPRRVPRITDSISLNAAVFAAVCLASRLPSSLDTFSLLLCAMELFVFFPNFRRTVKKMMPTLAIWSTVTWTIVTSILLYTVSTVALTFYVILCCFVTFLCPLWMVRLQSLKNNIYGPWDEAVLNKEEQER